MTIKMMVLFNYRVLEYERSTNHILADLPAAGKFIFRELFGNHKRLRLYRDINFA